MRTSPLSSINNILVVSLTNVGDIVLTFPVIDILRERFPQARLSVVIGPKGQTLFHQNPFIDQVYIFNKRQPLAEMLRWLAVLRRERFDLAVDLRNTAIPFLIGARRMTSPFLKRNPQRHMSLQHLERLRSVIDFEHPSQRRFALSIPAGDKAYLDERLATLPDTRKGIVTVTPGAANEGKRWPWEHFAELCDRIIETYRVAVVFGGDQNDAAIIANVLNRMKHRALDLSGKTTLTQFSHLVWESRLVISNDSAPVHIASYLNVPVIGLYGPTDPRVYGPWGEACFYLHKELSRISCEDVFSSFKLTANGVIFNHAEKY